ncbi:hypothetical protein JG687_00002389 [Phytophthora cactorum]|uniref:Uncharacterized protein n=1 Tax=Phytophthora cactorum TaxID=29920 RepID=A0A8T1UUG5_9STRA|nr:hypothetical protein JG687_00002389 [Phytophthora cactorum]
MVANREGRWDEDAVDGGPSSMELLLVWLRRDNNAARWRQAIERRMQATIARKVHEFFVDHGITHRTVSGIRSKLWQLGRQVGEADDWLASKGLLHVDGNEKARRTVMRLCPDYLETGGHVDIRNVKIKTFDGSVAQDDFESNVKDMWEELLDQVSEAQALDNQVWVCNEKKRWSETYQEYADHLLVMTDTLEGENVSQANARHALSTFVRLVYPTFSNVLKARIDVRSIEVIAEVDRALDVLVEFVETDVARKSTEFDKFDPKQPKASKKRSAQAQITVVEWKKKKTASGGTEDLPVTGQRSELGALVDCNDSIKGFQSRKTTTPAWTSTMKSKAVKKVQTVFQILSYQ